MWFAIGGVVLLALFMGANATASPPDFTNIIALFRTLGSATVPTTIPDTAVISIEIAGPKVIDFVKKEQGRGQAILIPKAFLKNHVNVGDQILSVNPVWVESAIAGGTFVLLPRL